MMRSKSALILIVAFALLSGACAHQDAANLGVAFGHVLGTPVGVVATTLDETFQTAGDIVEANPRYEKKRSPRPAAKPKPDRSYSPTTHADNTRYYRAEVIVKTNGPADLQSIEVQESRDVTAFWQAGN